MAASPAAAALAVLTLLAYAASPVLASVCKEVPRVDGTDQSPTPPSSWGKCEQVEAAYKSSHWCKLGRLGLWPEPPKQRAQQCLKFGRATVYRGPIYGSSPGHKAACAKVLRGDDRAAMVAVSTKYLKSYQGGWASDTGACGRCMCVRMHGADSAANPGLQKERASKHVGLTFLAQVGDRCTECGDDQIDVLQDRPFSWAPFDAAYNPHAGFVNAKDGLRGFRDPAMLRSSAYSPEAVGTWTAEWQWAPCDWDHSKCAALMRSMGYTSVWTPQRVEGIDSLSLRPMSALRGLNPFSQEPWTGRK